MPIKPAIHHGEPLQAPNPARATRARKALLASVVSLALLGASLNAYALALGALSVQSALGEPLRAEIEIPDMSSEQAASLQANIASRKEFQAAGVDYSAALTGAQISLQHRANGQPYLRVLGTHSVNEPFINLVVNAHWTGGHLRRDYTVLVNPPGRAALPAVAANPVQAAPQQARNERPTTTSPRLAPLSRVLPPPAQVATRQRPARSENTAAPERPVAENTRRNENTTARERPAVENARRNVTVRRGDTATGIARSSGLRGVSLDQMLVALLQSNPKAFIDGNVNLVKAGAVIRIPTAEQARATSPTDARKMVVAQTQDFHAYRQRVAQGSRAKAPAEANAAHETTGAVQSAKVDDQHAKEQSPDRLTVSKASAKDSTATQIAQSREESAQTDRVAELTKNIQELSRLESEAKTETKIASADKAATPETAANPNGKPAAGTLPSNEAASTAPASAAAHGSDTAVASAASAASAATPQPAQKSAAIQVKADPPPAPAGQPAWYDGLTENPSTLGLGGALIVLLAGLGLYSARRRKAKEAAAFADIGDDFDGDAGAHSGAGSAVADKPKEHAASGAAALEKAVAGVAAAGAVALNADSKETKDEPAPSALDLALDVGDENGAAAVAPAPADEPVMADFQPTALAPHMPVLESDPIGGTNTAEKPTPPSPILDFPATEVQFTPPSAPPPAAPSQKEAADDDKGMIDFDVDALPLPHGEPEWKADDAGVPPQGADDPLTTKLSLAQEFSNIGDNEGARSLAQEVVASATGELKKRAEDFLASL